jgi:hypothetical protein
VAQIDTKSIACISFLGESLSYANGFNYANGFFTHTEQWGKICITTAHILENQRGRPILVNGFASDVLYDARRNVGVDVAILRLPEQIENNSQIHFHKLAVAKAAGSVFYTHGWSLPQELSQLEEPYFEKIWGVRLKLQEKKSKHLSERSYKAWILRNDVNAKQTMPFSSGKFSRGWSGAPVFNVVRNVHDHKVIGVLKAVEENGSSSLAISVESLEFLQPQLEKEDEGVVFSVLPPIWRRLSYRGPKYVIGYQNNYRKSALAKIFARRFEETMGFEASPPSPEPESPYDQP